MITISSLCNYKSELELRWLNSVFHTLSSGWWVKAMFRPEHGETFFHELPIGMLPFLMPGLVVSQGRLLTTRKTGTSGRSVIHDLSKPEVIPAREAFSRSQYNLDGHFGGEHHILRYKSRDWTTLIPSMELIRFLFLHSKVQAQALLSPMGLMDLALTPAPGIYSEIQIDFSSEMPQALLRPEFIQELAWAAVHPDGRRAWDSVRNFSHNQRSLTLTPPPLLNCRIEFRGVALDKTWLVLEINALSGRVLPAQTILWTHPSEREKTKEPSNGKPGAPVAAPTTGPARPAHVQEHLVDDGSGSRTSINREVVLLGGKRGVFSVPAKIVKKLSPALACKPMEGHTPTTRKKRADAGQPIDPKLPSKIVPKKVSMGEDAVSDGLEPLEVSMLERADWNDIGDLRLLVETLKRVAQLQPDMTLTATLVFLKPGQAVSKTKQRRRSCLIAVFTSPTHPPCVIIDVEHSDIAGGLAGLIMRYAQPCSLAEMEKHIKKLLDAMVGRYGHWDKEAEHALAATVTVQRLPRLLRKTKEAGAKKYVSQWSKRLMEKLWG